jgi:hypothetical protein
VLLQPLSPGLIVALLGWSSIAISINFYHQPLFVAIKIQNELVQGMLPLALPNTRRIGILLSTMFFIREVTHG